jgi:hypothetical protein
MIDRDLYDFEEVRITMKDGASYDAVELARVLQKLGRSAEWSIREYLYMARCLLRGEGWEPPMHCLDFQELSTLRKHGPFNFAFTPRVDPYAEEKKRWLEVHDLLERACAGDAEAAIDYCRQVKAGTISAGPYAAGSAY